VRDRPEPGGGRLVRCYHPRDAEAHGVKLLVLACDVLARPVYLCAARSPHVVDLRLFERGLHNEPARLRDVLQREIDAAPPGYDAVVLGYGLCGGATAGIEARSTPVVLPRAHDCITLFLGARERYAAEFDASTTYWYVNDQVERNQGYSATSVGLGVSGDSDDDMDAVRAEYVEKYGEDNAEYLMEVMGAWKSHYQRAAFVGMGVADEAASVAYAREQADRRGWGFDRLEGSLVLLRKLIDGAWDDDILTLEPGERLAMSWDDAIVKAVPAG
jgi:hypothetical protein